MDPNKSVFFCDELPTKPNKKTGKILVTGATGYIGGILANELLHRGYNVKLMVRSPRPDLKTLWPKAEIITADALDEKSLEKALESVDTAYYLIHSLLMGEKDLESNEITSAKNFRKASDKNNVKRIIYLGALGDRSALLSSHLATRIKVEEELKKGSSSVTALRAAVILGSGSASFDIIHSLVTKLPILLIPPWANTVCQPIAIRDVIKYLVGVLENESTNGKSFDIGGNDILSYKDIIQKMATKLNKRRFFIPSIISNIKLYSYFANIFTPVPAEITNSLMKSIQNPVICKNNEISKYVPFTPLSIDQAINFAIKAKKEDRMLTRWTDGYPVGHELAAKFNELEKKPELSQGYSITTKKAKKKIFKSVCNIGGKNRWFEYNWMWMIRGLIDQFIMGAGWLRDRRSLKELRINDVINFWRVEEIIENELLILRAEMKVPGKAWLIFNIEDIKNKNKNDLHSLSVKAHFQPNSFWGYIYWYMMFPFHILIFRSLVKGIEKSG